MKRDQKSGFFSGGDGLFLKGTRETERDELLVIGRDWVIRGNHLYGISPNRCLCSDVIRFHLLSGSCSE